MGKSSKKKRRKSRGRSLDRSISDNSRSSCENDDDDDNNRNNPVSNEERVDLDGSDKERNNKEMNMNKSNNNNMEIGGEEGRKDKRFRIRYRIRAGGRKVDFVYPKTESETREVIPFIFGKTQKKQNGGDVSSTANSSKGAKKMDEEKQDEKTHRSNDTIESILYPDKKKKESKIHSLKVNTVFSSQDGVQVQNANDSQQQPPMEKSTTTDHSSNRLIRKTTIVDTLQHAVRKKSSKSHSASKPHEKGNSKDESSTEHQQQNHCHPGHLSGLSVEEVVRDTFGCRPRANSTDGELNLPQRGLCDERMVLESHKWKQDLKRALKPSPKGFINLGNTCFLNSTLQCLAHLPPFCQCLLAMPTSSVVTASTTKSAFDRNGKKRKISQGKRITFIISSLFQTVHNTTQDKQYIETPGPIAPRAIVHAIPTVGMCGSRNGYKFRPGRQEDAHEFLVHLLDAMNDGELREAGINQHASGWRDRLPVHRLDETTFIHRIFGGYLRSQVQCNLCNHRSNTYDPFLDLALEVSKKSCNSVANAFGEFTRKEILDSANRWKCSGCGKRVCATKQLTVFRPPLSLCIQLKRFAFTGGTGGGSFSYGGMISGHYHARRGFGSRNGGTKITKPIEFPAEMKLPLSDGRSCEYTLTGIVIHVGGCASSGHYTAYVKKPGKTLEHSQWYHLDDSFVEPVSERTVLRQKDAYLLFYCRKEVKLEFPSPPIKPSMSTEQAKEYSRARAKAKAKARSDSLSADDASSHSTGAKGEEDRLSGDDNRSQSTVNNIDSFSVSERSVKSRLQMQMDSFSISERVTKSSVQRQRDSLSCSEQENLYISENSSRSTVKDAESAVNMLTSGDDKDAQAAFKRLAYGCDDENVKSLFLKRAQSFSSNGRNVVQGKEEAFENEVQQPNDINNKSKDTTSWAKEKVNEMEVISEDSTLLENSTLQHAGSLSLPGEEGTMPPSSENNDGGLVSVEKNTSSLKSPSQASRQSVSLKESKKMQRRIVLDGRSGSGEKVSVSMGPRYKSKKWKPKTDGMKRGDPNCDLLGNLPVDKWGDGDNDDNDAGHTSKGFLQNRSELMEKVRKDERSKKRKMRVDHWDAVLDQGKKKKVKKKHSHEHVNDLGTPVTHLSSVFQRIQSGMQKMNRGNPKGWFHQSSQPQQKYHQQQRSKKRRNSSENKKLPKRNY